MSSLIRRIQIRQFRLQTTTTQVPVLDPFAKNVVVGHNWPFNTRQLAITRDGQRIYHPDDCVTKRERAIVELLHNDRLAAQTPVSTC